VRILIVTPRQPRTTGNWVAASRQQKGLESLGHTVRIVEAEESGIDLEEIAEQFVPDVVNVLHAYRSGKPWLACRHARYLPLAVTLTGTDVNHGLDNPEQRTTILRVLAKAEAVITINPLTMESLARNYPEWIGKLHHVAPAVDFGHGFWDLRGQWNIPRRTVLFLHPAGIRPVKGNWELLEMFERVACAHQCVLVFCGPILDEAYAREFLKTLRERTWAIYAGEVPAEVMRSVLGAADVVLNNSCSEGYSNTLHEAACLGVPILARNIPGNLVAFEPGRQGLTYDSPEDFVRYALYLAGHPEVRRRFSRPMPPSYSLLGEARQLEKIYRALTRQSAWIQSSGPPL
jgi:glycosyltransferase involved in cell wall biosynthesis